MRRLPNDPSLPSYAGKFTAWDAQTGAPDATITSTATFHDTLRGSDGSRIRDRGLFHVTVLADGTILPSWTASPSYAGDPDER
jgi:hypothetical protein